MVQTLAAINVRRWSFPAVGSFCFRGLAAVGGRSAGGSRLGSTFGLRLRTSSGTYQQMSWGCKVLSGVLLKRSLERGRWRSLDCEHLSVCDACSEATWRESSSIRSSIPTGLSGVEGEMLAVVGRGVSSQILSARWDVESRLPSVWSTRMACTCGGSRLAQMVRRKSSGTSGARLLRCRRNGDGFRSPIS